MADIDRKAEYTPKVSVILPVYNVERYIRRCIESLQAQTMTELEFIFVDDCSTDGSMVAVEEWATEDDRVRILRNEENLGAGPSRNRGIEIAKGEYLSFIDPDDYISPDFYELLYAAAIADGGHEIAKGTSQKLDHSDIITYQASRLNLKIKKCLEKGCPLYTSFTYEHWSSIYHRSLFDNPEVRYGTSRTGEDITFLLRCCYQTEDIVFEGRARYFHVQRESSTYKRGGIERINNEIDKLREMADFLVSQSIDNVAKEYLLGRIKNVITAKMIPLLVRGKLTRKEFAIGIERLVAFAREIPGLAEYDIDEILKTVPNASSFRVLQLKHRLRSTVHFIKRRFIHGA